jgi:hypothetical protein
VSGDAPDGWGRMSAPKGKERVDTTRLVRLLEDLQDGPGDKLDRQRKFSEQFPGELAKIRRQAYRQMNLLPVPINGSTNRGLKAGYFMKRLRDGSVGYLQRRVDDCLQAAIASCCQIPIHKVPDLRIDTQLYVERKDPEEIERGVAEKMTRFMREYGITIMAYPSRLPTQGRWVGVVPRPGIYSDHCLLMDGKNVLFDTTNLMDDEIRSRIYDYADIEYGITFNR